MRSEDSRQLTPPNPPTVASGQSIEWTNVVLALLLAGVCCATDLWSKERVFAQLGPPGPDKIYWLWPEYVGLETSINTGALFGLGQGRVALFAAASFVAVAGVLWWLVFAGGSHSRWISATLGLILGGILGNLYDRLGMWGTEGVRDWILLRYGDFIWPNFNFADSFLVCGAILIIWHALRQDATFPTDNSTAMAKHAG